MSRKILFVDDEEELQMMVGEYLKFVGHECWSARNADEAIKVASEMTPDVILLDLNLGGQSGDGLLKILNQKHPAVAIILYTGMEPDDDTVKSMLSKCAQAHYLRKDGNLEELLKTIDGVSTAN